MAAKGGADVPEINYVAKENFWKTVTNKEKFIANHEWPERNAEPMRVYDEMYKKLGEDQVVQKLPQHESHVVNRFSPYTPKPENIRCLPETTQKEYGYKVGNTPVMVTDGWFKRRALRYMYKQMGWPEDHQW